MRTNIGETCFLSTVRTYGDFRDTAPMRKNTERTIWERVREAMKEAKLPYTQIAVARFLHIKQPSISEWNEPNRGPKLAHMIEIAKAANVCVEWLYTERGPKWPGPPEDVIAKRLWAIWGEVSDAAKIECFEAAVKGKAVTTGVIKPEAVFFATHEPSAKPKR